MAATEHSNTPSDGQVRAKTFTFSCQSISCLKPTLIIQLKLIITMKLPALVGFSFHSEGVCSPVNEDCTTFKT